MYVVSGKTYCNIVGFVLYCDCSSLIQWLVNFSFGMIICYLILFFALLLWHEMNHLDDLIGSAKKIKNKR